MNTLYYGDNLKILQDRNYFPDACVDLIYLDPPFNSNRNYNVLFKNESGIEAESQITAFEDTCHWNASAEAASGNPLAGAGTLLSPRTSLRRPEILSPEEPAMRTRVSALRPIE